MTKKTKLLELMICQHLNTGELPPLPIFLLVDFHCVYISIYLIGPEISQSLQCFQISNYEKEIEGMKNMTRQEFVASIRRYNWDYFTLTLKTIS